MAVADATAETGAYGEDYYFLLRRLHSLSGIIPVGAFLCIHMLLNGAMLVSADAYQNAVNLVHSLDKVGVLKLVEVIFIFIPIAFHAIVGIIIWRTSQPNVTIYRYSGNVRYTLQRWTAWITLAFILVHLWHMHWLGSWLPGGGQFDAHDAPASTIAVLESWWWGPVYALGVLSAVFHLANGIWTFLIVWGVTIGPRSQRLSGTVCITIGIVLGLLGIGSLYKLKTTDPSTLSTPAVIQGHTTSFGRQKRGQVQFAGTARRVSRKK